MAPSGKNLGVKKKAFQMDVPVVDKDRSGFRGDRVIRVTSKENMHRKHPAVRCKKAETYHSIMHGMDFSCLRLKRVRNIA